jgi:hypothetical protein
MSTDPTAVPVHTVWSGPTPPAAPHVHTAACVERPVCTLTTAAYASRDPQLRTPDPEDVKYLTAQAEQHRQTAAVMLSYLDFSTDPAEREWAAAQSRAYAAFAASQQAFADVISARLAEQAGTEQP